MTDSARPDRRSFLAMAAAAPVAAAVAPVAALESLAPVADLVPVRPLPSARRLGARAFFVDLQWFVERTGPFPEANFYFVADGTCHKLLPPSSGGV